MVQELIDLRKNIIEGRYQEALKIIDELEEIEKQTTIIKIESYLVRIFIHLIKNQVEKHLTNSSAASISHSIMQIKKLNLKDNKTSYYIKENEWQEILTEEIETAINPASVEILDGSLSPIQLGKTIHRQEIIDIAKNLLNLTYRHSKKELPMIINHRLKDLPGGEEWFNK